MSTGRFRLANSAHGWTTIWLLAVIGAFVSLASPAASWAQRRPSHVHPRADQPPGTIGRQALARGGPLPGYFQPVQLIGPPGSFISVAIDGRFDRPRPSPVTVGLLIGQVYRFKVTNIPGREGDEVFPSVEVIDRLYPPRGEKTRFPIPIRLTADELAMASDGLFVTRVIYLEDPQAALPQAELPDTQRYFEVAAGEDPLHVAATLGRPMAILRMGSVIADSLEPPPEFLFGSPPLKIYDGSASRPTAQPLRAAKSPSMPDRSAGTGANGQAAEQHESLPLSPPSARDGNARHSETKVHSSAKRDDQRSNKSAGLAIPSFIRFAPFSRSNSE